MEEEKTKIKIDCSAIAYYFMIHSYRKEYSPKFEETELELFVEDFCDYVDISGYVFVNKRNEILDKDAIVSNIMGNFVNFSKDYEGQKFCYFSSDMFDIMRYNYQNAPYEFEELIINYETELMRGDFVNQDTYKLFEKYYRKSIESFISKEDEEKTFDA